MCHINCYICRIKFLEINDRGDFQVPSFHKRLTMLKDKVKVLLDEALQENTALFLIEMKVEKDNQITVIIDGDEGVSVNDCIAVSRKIEHNLDREEEDFSLEVASAGVSASLRIPRQFQKNIGRKIAVKTENEAYEAELCAVDDEKIDLKWKTREPKPVGKGKVTVTKEAAVKYSEIIEAKVMITF